MSRPGVEGNGRASRSDASVGIYSEFSRILFVAARNFLMRHRHKQPGSYRDRRRPQVPPADSLNLSSYLPNTGSNKVWKAKVGRGDSRKCCRVVWRSKLVCYGRREGERKVPLAIPSVSASRKEASNPSRVYLTRRETPIHRE